MINDVVVNIKLSEVVGNSGTWFPCLLVVDAEATEAAYEEYTKLSELVNNELGKKTYGEDSAVYKAASKMFAQNNAPKKFAVLALSAFSGATVDTYATKGWRQLVLVGEHSNVKDIAEYVEGTDKLMLFAGVSSKEELEALYATTKAYDRTFIVYHTKDETAVAALVGATAGLNVGSFTYKNIKIKGVEADTLTASELEVIHAKGGNAIVEKCGDIVTSEGKCASGQFADVIDSRDWVIQNITYKTQKVLNNNPKVPYTNQGIAMLEAATVEALKTAFNNGMIATKDDGTPDYSTSFAMRSETTEADRATRHYPYGTFTFALAGAIHSVVVNGVVTF